MLPKEKDPGAGSGKQKSQGKRSMIPYGFQVYSRKQEEEETMNVPAATLAKRAVRLQSFEEYRKRFDQVPYRYLPRKPCPRLTILGLLQTMLLFLSKPFKRVISQAFLP